MKWLVVAGIAIVGLIVLDRLARWAERRGWIYWREKEGLGSSSAAAGLAVFNELFAPEKKRATETLEQQATMRDDIANADGDSPSGEHRGGPYGGIVRLNSKPKPDPIVQSPSDGTVASDDPPPL